MTVYLVDFENVRSEGLKGVEELTSEDKVVIFYSQNANSITFDVHDLLRKSSAEIETYRILRGGRNSLDFQLSTYLGYLVMENSYREIVIISKDKGFLCVKNFWEENSEKCNCEIKLCKSIRAAFADVQLANDIDDGLTGNFIERLNGKDGVILSVNGEEIRQDEENDVWERDFNTDASQVEEGHRTMKEKSEQDNSVNKGTENVLASKEFTGEFIRENSKDGSKELIGKRVGGNYGRPPGPKRPTYSTNIFTKQEPYYRVPNQEKSIKNKPWQEPLKKNEPWKQSPGASKPWKPEKKPVYGEKKSKEVSAEVKQDVLPLNPQNPTSKNKIFTAEVKLNIDEDVRNLIKDKYDETYVSLLVDAIGMSTGKQHFYKMMVNKVGQEVGLDLYRLVKSHYANLKRK